jgi:hypothetical protein
MKLWLLALLAIATLLAYGQDKRKSGSEVEVLDAKVRRVEGNLTVDGQVRNTGDRPIQGLTLIFDFLASSSQVITQRTGPIDEVYLEPGDEASFHVYIRDAPRAVHVRIGARDEKKNHLKVVNEGPFGIP